jgi:hypothetical protein
MPFFIGCRNMVGLNSFIRGMASSLTFLILGIFSHISILIYLREGLREIAPQGSPFSSSWFTDQVELPGQKIIYFLNEVLWEDLHRPRYFQISFIVEF